MSDQSWAGLVQNYGSLDDICRMDPHGRPYIDVDAMDTLVQTTRAVPVIQAWQQVKGQIDVASLHSLHAEDAILGWGGFMRAHRGTHPASYEADAAADVTSPGGFGPGESGGTPEFLAVLHHAYHSPEEAWQAAKAIEVLPEIEDVTLAQMTDYLTRVAAAMCATETAEDPRSGENAAAGPAEAAATVGQCFAQAGLWWVIVFCVALVALIIGVVMSAGTVAVLAAEICGILIGAGIWATFGALVALVICLGASLSIQINY